MVEAQNIETLISFQGDLSYDTIGDLINKLKKQAETHNFKLNVFKRVLSATIESLENIYKYHAHLSQKNNLGADLHPKFVIQKSDDSFIITAGNPILNEDVHILKERLETINNLDLKGLRNMYKDTITNGQFSRKGGAGLGFMEMVKVSGNNLSYEFKGINDEFTYFILELNIPFIRPDHKGI
jgi:hypothetical protein